MTPPPAGWRFELHETLPSTSDFCIGRAAAGEPDGLAVLAVRQTRGRGSRGREWNGGPEGNLAFSVLFRPAAHERPTGWSFLAALALHDALDEAVLRLKWPNDVLLHGRKLAGILVEAGTEEGNGWVVIGFGVNLATAPVMPDRPVACFTETGRTDQPQAVAERLMEALSARRTVWRRDGFAAIRRDWLRLAHPLGTPLGCLIGGERLDGYFRGIDADGALLLGIGDRVERIHTAEVLMPERITAS